MLLLCLAGWMIASRLARPGNAGVCQAAGCQRVLSSSYSHAGKWSIAEIGKWFYAVMILLWAGVVGLRPNWRRGILVASLILCLAAVAISLIFVAIQIFVIRAICPFCLISAFICMGMAFISWSLFRQNNWAPQPLASVVAIALLASLFMRSSANDTTLVARVGDIIITRQEMEQAISPQIRQEQWEIYLQEKNWLDQKVTDLLVAREAGQRHIAPSQLVQSELNDVVSKEVTEYLKKHATDLRPEDIPVARQELETRFKADRAAEIVAGLSRKYGAVEYLEPPTIDEKDLSRIAGLHRGADANTAPIRLVIFSDFGCEYCAHTSQTIATLMQKYPDRISLTYHFLPLEIHPRSKEAAIAAECAAMQNKFWPFHDALMTHGGALGGIDFTTLAHQLGLNQNQFRACLAGNIAAENVEESVRQANQLGIDATPAVFLNGKRIGGDLSEAQLEDWIRNVENKR